MTSLFPRDYRWARLALLLGAFSFAILYPAKMWAGSDAGWMWYTPDRNLPFENMLVAMYAVNGGFLLLAMRDPIRFLPLIDFTIVANIVHGFAMLNDAARLGMTDHLRPGGDVPGTFLVPVLLLLTHPRRFYLFARRA